MSQIKNSKNISFTHVTENNCTFKITDEQSFTKNIKFRPLPDVLLIHAPVKDFTLQSYIDRSIQLSKPIKHIHLVGKGVNAKDCTESVLDTLFSVTQKLKGKVTITEAVESRKVRYPAEVKGDEGNAIRQLYTYQAFSMIGNNKFSTSIIVRVNGANVTVLKDALELCIKQLNYSKINKEVWDHATINAGLYLEWLKKTDLKVLGNYKKEVGTVTDIIKSMYPYLEDDIVFVIKDLLSKKVDPIDMLLLISSLKFAILMKLSGMVEIYRHGRGFRIPDKDKFAHLFNDNVIYPKAIEGLENTLKLLKDLDLTPCYDLYDMLKVEKEITGSKDSFKKLIDDSLIEEDPDKVDMGNITVDIITDHGEEIDDETRDISIKKRWKFATVNECLIDSNLKPSQRLARWLSIVLK